MEKNSTGQVSLITQGKDTIKSPLTVLDDLISDAEKNGEEQSTINTDDAKITLASFEQFRITAEKTYSNNEPTITWSGEGIASPGNITAIGAASKAGKTAFQSVIVAGALVKDGDDYEGFSEIEIQPNEGRKAVVVFDTEQAEYDQQYNVKTILRRINVKSTPDNFLSYNIRQLTIDRYKEITNQICEAAAKEHDGIYMIVVDGGADYIKSVNDEAQATELVEYFTHLAIRYHCPVIVVVHQNPGSDKERGHFGSQIQRKCYGLIQIKKDGDTSIAEPKMMRRAGIGSLQPIHYQYDRDKGYHVQVGVSGKEDKQILKLIKIEGVIKEAIPPLESFGYRETVRKIMGRSGCSEKTAKNHLDIALENGWLNKGVDGKYRWGKIGGVKWGNSG